MACTLATDCLTTPPTCSVNVCSTSGCCTTGPASQGATCSGANGAAVCDGAGNCVQCNVAGDCGVSASCSSGELTPGDTCSAHTCVAGTPAPCTGGFVCASTTTCKMSCSADGDCESANDFCQNGGCVGMGGSGATCSGDDQCTSLTCGVTGTGSHCCASACSTASASCGATNCDTSGACIFPSKGTTCTDSGGKVCNGSGTCVGCNSPSDCSASCVNGALQAATCTSGTCGLGSSAPCAGNFQCASSTSCLTACGTNDATGDANCATGFYCDGVGNGSCQALLANGATCSRSAQCQSVNCVGGSCVAATVLMLGGINPPETDAGVPEDAGTLTSLGAELHPTATSNGTWSSPAGSLGNTTQNDVGLAFVSTGATPSAVGVMQDAFTLDLLYTTWTLGGTFQTFAGVGSGVTTRQVPAIAGSGGSAYVAFQGTDFNQYFALYSGGSWSPNGEAINTTGGLPTPPAIAVVGTTPSVALYGASPNNPLEQDRTSPGTWSSTTIDTTIGDYASTPSLVAMNGGSADLMAVYVSQNTSNGTGQPISYTRSSSTSTWSAGTVITGASVPVSASFGPVERVALAALPGGQAMCAWRDATTNQIEYATWNGSTWTVSAFPTVVTLASAPALAHGVAGATAEIAYVDGSAVAWHARLVGGSWTTPVQVFTLTAGSHVAIASAP